MALPYWLIILIGVLVVLGILWLVGIHLNVNSN